MGFGSECIDNKYTHVCPYCYLQFRSWKALSQHKKTKHEDKIVRY